MPEAAYAGAALLNDHLRPYGKRSAFARREPDIELLYPRDAAAKVVTSTGAAWNWSAYVEIVASTSADFWPVTLHTQQAGKAKATGVHNVIGELEIATGAAGSEVPFATFPVAFDAFTIDAENASGITWPMNPKKIVAATRLAARSRINLADTSAILNLALYLAGYEAAAKSSDLRYPQDQLLRGDFASDMKQTPAGAALSVAVSAFPNFGAWVEVIASAPADLLVWGITTLEDAVGFSNSSRKVQLGLGAAAAEVAYTQIGVPAISGTIGSGHQRLRRPLLVYSGERLAVRQSGGGSANGMKFLYEEL